MRRAIATTVLALALPTAAQAATVHVYVPPCALEQSKYGACYPDEALFEAAGGEQNKVTIERAASEPPSYSPRLTLKDEGAPLTAGAGCTQVDEHTATCSGYSLIARVDAGDADDAVDGIAYEADGGPGNDTLSGAQLQHGGPGDDKLQAGETGALLDGGPGHDTIAGGNGSDTIADPADAGERDTVDGGDGIDTMSYAGRRAGLNVSLLQPLAGEDALSGIESLRGGNGNDTLMGDAGPNVLDGGAGNDMADGGDGDDTVAGDTGADALLGGAGNDKLDPGEDKARNLVSCGAGEDHAAPQPNTLIGPDCELIGFDDFDLSGIVRLHLPVRSVAAPLLTIEPLGCVDLPCAVELTVTAKRRVIGRTRVVQRKRRPRLPKRVALRLSPAGARMLRKSAPLQARISIVTSDGGERSRANFVVALTHS